MRGPAWPVEHHSSTTGLMCGSLNPVQEKNGATVTANLFTGLGIDEIWTRTDGTGLRGFLPDALGTTIALADNTGTLQTQYTYEPFGSTSVAGQANTNSFQYTGREHDDGLYYYRARYYHPRLQRFISEDPIGFAAGDLNIYSYVHNRPASKRDPFGLESATVTLGIDPFNIPYPYNPLYGPSSANCLIYSDSTVFTYLCKDFFPDRPSTNCTRKCLQSYYPAPNVEMSDLARGTYTANYLAFAHPLCFFECGLGPLDACPMSRQ